MTGARSHSHSVVPDPFDAFDAPAPIDSDDADEQDSPNGHDDPGDPHR